MDHTIRKQLFIFLCILPMAECSGDPEHFDILVISWQFEHFWANNWQGINNLHRTIKLWFNEEKLFHMIFTTYQNYPLALKCISIQIHWSSKETYHFFRARHSLKSKALKWIIIGHKLAIVLLTKHISKDKRLLSERLKCSEIARVDFFF